MKKIDVIRYFEDKNLEFWTSGKNVKKGDVNIRCWNCNDRSQHLRIRPNNWVSCWKCDNSMHFQGLIQHFENCDWKEAKKILKDYETLEEISIIHNEYIAKPIDSFKMPYGIDPFLHDIHKKYLVKRGFDPDELQKKYKLHSCLNKNKYYKNRIIIPTIYDGHIVNFTARSIVGAEPKYLDASMKESVIPKERCLFGLDDVEEDGVMVIVEGQIDAIAIGNGAVATSTTNFTIHQAELIRKKNPRKVYIFYDNPEFDKNALKMAEELEKYLYFIKNIHYIELSGAKKDAGDLSNSEIMELRSMIF